MIDPAETEITDQPRIAALIAGKLEKIASGNWTILYRDPDDGRFWEITYPHSERHGGGPALLSVMSADAAKAAYNP